MKIQINLPDDVDKKVEFYKTEHELKTKADAIIQMLKLIPFNIDIPDLPKVKKNGAKK